MLYELVWKHVARKWVWVWQAGRLRRDGWNIVKERGPLVYMAKSVESFPRCNRTE